MDSYVLKRIRLRWTTEKKVSTKDIEWMLTELDRIETLEAADRLKRASSPLSGLFDDMFNTRRPR